MTMTPTPEQFLAMREPDEDETENGMAPWEQQILDEVNAERADPLESIAASLRQLVGALQEDKDEEQAPDWLRESLDDLQAKHEVLVQLVEEIEAIVKPSTSKLANTVRQTIGRWRAPEASAGEPVEDEKPGGPGAVQCGLCERYFADQDLLERHVCGAGPMVPAANAAEMGHRPPAADAGVEEWRKYARSLGHEVSDQTNRSQIRTLLGLPHHDA
ncbi:hypothetical protein [Nocardioides sp. 503]|uniref:hypothetical protein n=1 Tax=Nocardioides sp. 503 TaxID=2508326 RepID=UPI00106F1807|nr:hypothetical protein [Nocardioides sp. 503]